MGKTPLYLAVKVSLRVALEEILRNYILLIHFELISIFLRESCNQSLK